jgi:hypothetical protein
MIPEGFPEGLPEGLIEGLTEGLIGALFTGSFESKGIKKRVQVGSAPRGIFVEALRGPAPASKIRLAGTGFFENCVSSLPLTGHH